jgi:uncharacterized protein
MIVDCHCHIFTPKIIENVSTRRAMVKELGLNVQDAWQRCDPLLLEESASQNNVEVCLLLPTAAPDKVRAENERHLRIASGHSRLRSLATLHPAMVDLSEEIRRIFQLGTRGFKFSSFSQRFELASPEVESMLSEIGRIAEEFNWRPAIILDTFTRADIHFGADALHLTRPQTLMRVVRRHPEINIVGSHMGGLAEEWDELRGHLTPSPNFYLDTSNAAHTLNEQDFVYLLNIHGPGRILFGTDWPWFHHAEEIPLIRSLLEKAGFNQSDKEEVFGGNACRLFGL